MWSQPSLKKRCSCVQERLLSTRSFLLRTSPFASLSVPCSSWYRQHIREGREGSVSTSQGGAYRGRAGRTWDYPCSSAQSCRSTLGHSRTRRPRLRASLLVYVGQVGFVGVEDFDGSQLRPLDVVTSSTEGTVLSPRNFWNPWRTFQHAQHRCPLHPQDTHATEVPTTLEVPCELAPDCNLTEDVFSIIIPFQVTGGSTSGAIEQSCHLTPIQKLATRFDDFSMLQSSEFGGSKHRLERDDG